MAKYICKLGDKRPQVCKGFPLKSADIKEYKRAIEEESTCVAKVGGEGCVMCGQCCRDKPWPSKEEVPEGIPETNYEDWQDPKTKACIWLEEITE